MNNTEKIEVVERLLSSAREKGASEAQALEKIRTLVRPDVFRAYVESVGIRQRTPCSRPLAEGLTCRTAV